MSRRPLIVLLPALALAAACVRSIEEVPPPLDTPPPEPPAVAAEIAPEPAPEPEPEPEPPPGPTLDVLATAVEAGGLITFVSAVEAAGLRETLSGPGPFTIFAPSDRAFAALPKGELDRLLKNKKKLATLLRHHVVAGPPITPETARDPDAPILTLAGAELPPIASPTREFQATNGVLYVLDIVLPAPGKPAAKPASSYMSKQTSVNQNPTPAKKSAEPAPPKPTEPAKKSADPGATPPAP